MEVSIITESAFKKLLEYLDNIFTKEKVEINSNGMMGLHYYGLIFEDYFSDSILSTQYLDINDYFHSEYELEYSDDKSLVEQYGLIPQEKRCKVIESLYNILYLSHFGNKEINIQCVLNKIKNYLFRLNIEIIEQEHIGIQVYQNSKIGEGYYSEVFKVTDGIVKKQLKKEHLSNENICKKFKYEYEMMNKLKECGKIVKVFDYNDSEKSYTMEQCDECLYDYLSSKIDLELSEKVKIINDILEAMKYAHDHNVIHRDLHLGNIMKLKDNFLICDFGLGKDKDVIRSLIISATPKNNHLFLDPIGLQDFRLLDEFSDIYSIGKIIEYIMCNGFISTNHIFSYIVLKCTSREKQDRYKNINEIQNDIQKYLEGEEKIIKQEEINKKIANGIFDLEVQEYIMRLVNSSKLCNYIVNQKNHNIYKIVLKLDIEKRMKIAKQIIDNYVSATGYMGWSNYSLFGSLAYNLYINEKDNSIKQIYKEVLDDCGKIRYDIKELCDQLV